MINKWNRSDQLRQNQTSFVPTEFFPLFMEQPMKNKHSDKDLDDDEIITVIIIIIIITIIIIVNILSFIV